MQLSKRTAGILLAAALTVSGACAFGEAPAYAASAVSSSGASEGIHVPIVESGTKTKKVTVRTAKAVTKEQKEKEAKAKAEEEEKLAAEKEAKEAKTQETEKTAPVSTSATSNASSQAASSQTRAAQPAQQTQTVQPAYSGSVSQSGLANYILSCNPSIGQQTAQAEASAFIRYGNAYGVRPALLAALARCESNFTPGAYNGAGYYGLMQISNSVGSAYAGATGNALFGIDTNIRAGAAYLAANIRMFGSETVGLCGYMFGSGTVRSGNYSTGMANYRISIANQIAAYM
ncbi:MAG: lytic transglycosylase domain-containing protein [Eubacteriales bacterium]|nr:lytic transglycosylase domain-containing protein [Eubacteriales bacterium]